ncbi:MAG: helix-turn-helix transcriptional regulator [Candidatus Thorarchaeota archaeon]
MVGSKHSYLVVGVLIVGLLLGPAIIQADGQAGSQDIIMSNMYVTATMDSECTTSLVIYSEVKYRGSAQIDYFDLRIDVRGLNVSGASLNGTSVATTIIPESNYNLLRVMSTSPMTNGTLVNLNLNLTTDCLQEQIGLNDDETMYVNHLIYYIRPLYEVRNLTFTAILPIHSILQSDAVAPLYPNPTMNFTDGYSPVYVWYRNQMYPGQEVVFIIRYQLPAAIIQDPPSPLNSLVFGALAFIIGAAAVLFIERIPMMIKKLQSRTIIAPIRLSKQEEQVLDFLSKKGGSSPQREIYEELDMSQSLASTVLTSLEERKLIKRFREGRENIVHLMEE